MGYCVPKPLRGDERLCERRKTEKGCFAPKPQRYFCATKVPKNAGGIPKVPPDPSRLS